MNSAIGNGHGKRRDVGCARRYYTGVQLDRHVRVVRRPIAWSVAAALALAPAAAAQPAGTAPVKGSRAQRSAPRPDPRRVLPLSTTAAWKVTLPALASSAPALDANRVYVPLRSGSLAAYALATGAEAWTVPAVETSVAPAVGDGLVFLAGDRRLEVFEAETGASKWRADLPAPATAPVFWGNGWLLVITGEGEATMRRAANGEVLWQRTIGSPVHARAAAAGTHVYLLADDARVLTLDLVTGATVWEATLPAKAVSITPLDDRVFVGDTDRFFYCLSAKDGKIKWRWRTGAAIVGTAVVDDESVYFLSLDGVLRALDRGNGHQRWKATIPHRPTTGPFLSARRLAAPGISVEIPAYSARDGSAAGGVKLGGEPSMPPLFIPAAEVAGLDRFLVVTDDTTLQLLVSMPPPLRSTPLPGPPYGMTPTVIVEGIEAPAASLEPQAERPPGG
jgi:outer membrane protein assembly factor BamB